MDNRLNRLLRNANNKKVNTKVNNTNYLKQLTDPNYYKNTAQNAYNYSQDQLSQAKDSFQGLSNLNKFLLIFGILILVLIISLIIKYYWDQKVKERFISQPLFMTGIENYRPHNAKEKYRYIDPNTGRATPFIPGYLFQEPNGTQYTFSFWMFISGKEWNYRFGEWKHIFHRGTPPPGIQERTGEGGYVGPVISNNNSIVKLTQQLPGFWISPKENTLNCVMTTDKGEERVTIDDIEINKWINIVLVVNTNNIALYRNGKLEKMVNLLGRINSSKEAVYINYFGGFAGNMAYLQFFDKVLTPLEVQELYREFENQIQKYIHHQFNKEQDRLKICPSREANGRCTYIAEVKHKMDKEEYITRIIKIYTILYDNTPSYTKQVREDTLKTIKNILEENKDKMTLIELKKNVVKLVNSIKPLGKKIYQYIDTANQTQDANLSDKEYQQIKELSN